MTTAAQAIEQVAAATGTMQATVFRAARALREADVRTWPQGTAGRGKSAHIEPHHLVNLAVALSVADPITTAPTMVAGYRGLVCAGLPMLLPEQESASIRLLVDLLDRQSDLGTLLDKVVDFLGDPSEKHRGEAAIEAAFAVRFDTGSAWPSATIEFGRVDRGEHQVSILFLPRQGVLAGHDPTNDFAPSMAAAPIIRTVTLTAPFWGMLGDLWSDTQSYRLARGARFKEGHSPTLSKTQPGASSVAVPENETAAINLWQGINAAVVSDQHTTSELDGQEQCHPTGVREMSQAPSKSCVGRSRNRAWSTPHDKYRDGGASRAAA